MPTSVIFSTANKLRSVTPSRGLRCSMPASVISENERSNLRRSLRPVSISTSASVTQLKPRFTPVIRELASVWTTPPRSVTHCPTSAPDATARQTNDGISARISLKLQPQTEIDLARSRLPSQGPHLTHDGPHGGRRADVG